VRIGGYSISEGKRRKDECGREIAADRKKDGGLESAAPC
jgi:hypothetical protein